MLIVVQFFSPTSPLPSLLFFVCHSNDELSMRRSPSCKLSDLTCSDAFEPCRLLMHSNKSLFFPFIGVYYTQGALCALKGSSQNNFTSSAESEINKRKKETDKELHTHAVPPHKVAVVIPETKQHRLFQSHPSNKLFKMLNFYLTHLPIPCFSKCAPSVLFPWRLYLEAKVISFLRTKRQFRLCKTSLAGRNVSYVCGIYFTCPSTKELVENV